MITIILNKLIIEDRIRDTFLIKWKEDIKNNMFKEVITINLMMNNIFKEDILSFNTFNLPF